MNDCLKGSVDVCVDGVRGCPCVDARVQTCVCGSGCGCACLDVLKCGSACVNVSVPALMWDKDTGRAKWRGLMSCWT